MPHHSTLHGAFPHFNSLPLEIRNLVWIQAVEDIGPRVIYLYQFPLHVEGSFYAHLRPDHEITDPLSTSPSLGWLEFPKGYKRIAPIPGVILACHESHSMASRYYQRAFPSLGCPAEIYFDFDRDILHIDRVSFMEDYIPLPRALNTITSADLHRVRHLSVTASQFMWHKEVKAVLSGVLSAFANIKRLTLVSQPQSTFLSKFEMPEDDLVLRDRSDFDADPIDELEDEFLFEDQVHVPTKQLESARIKWNKQIDYKRRKYNNRDLSCWEMPEIDYKLLMTDRIARELDALCKNMMRPLQMQQTRKREFEL